ncbi:MAG: FGGY-family carbohydrate kinase [Spirochaetaceae bacterium]|jgi:xylulokinase|nr:FGGY-family carbohydrate kinase [Spirochaetaceae bacterium]
MTWLCADIGTSSLKAALIDAEGVQHAFVRMRYRQSGRDGGTATPVPTVAADWEAAFKDAVFTLRRQTQTDIAAICVSGNGPTFVPVDREGHALPPLAWYNAPKRTAGPSLFLPHIAHFIAEQREQYDNTETLFSCQEWLAWRLGAQAVSVLPNERFRPSYWDEAQCAAIGCAMRKLPPLVPLGTVIGKTGGRAEKDFALPPHIPIVAGGPDFIMALIGTGTLAEGLVCDRAGTSEGINVCSRVPATTGNLRTLPHIADGLFNVGALIPRSGILFDDYRRDTLQEDRDYKEHLDALLKSASLSEEDIAGRRVLLQMARQVKEKIALLREHGFPVTEMRVSGGQAKNALWNRMKAKIAGVTLAVPAITDGELAGNACLCAVAQGEAADLHEAAAQIVRIKERYFP